MNISVENLENALDLWENRQGLEEWHTLEILCFELAKLFDSVAIVPINRGHNNIQWLYLLGGHCLKCSVTITHQGWYVGADYVSIPEDLPEYKILDVGTDLWTKTLSWTLETLALFQNNPEIEVAKATIDDIDAWSSWLDNISKEMLPEIIRAYRYIRGFNPKIIRLSVGFSNALPAEGTIAVYQKYEDEYGYSGTVAIKTKALEQGEEYIRTILAHELIHYLLDTGEEYDPHEGEFCVMADLLGIPRKYQV